MMLNQRKAAKTPAPETILPAIKARHSLHNGMLGFLFSTPSLSFFSYLFTDDLQSEKGLCAIVCQKKLDF